ncbi:MAG: amidase family protein, partial [Hyphomonadaceae bacterium]
VADAAGRAPDPEVAAAVTAAGALCARLGHHVSEVAFDLDAEAFTEAFVLYWAAGAAQAAAQVRRIAPNAPLESLLEPLTLQLADHYARAPHDAFENAVASLRAVQPRYDAMFAAQDVLLTPVLSAPPPPLGYLAPTLPFDVGFARVMDYARYTPLANVAGAPALSLPLGWSGAGLPIGAHFMAARGDERTLLELAYELEIASPWAMRRPPIWAGLA